MSTPASPPTSPAYVPYQAYKSKRHSRNLSSSNSHLIPNQSPPPITRPSNGADISAALLQPPRLFLDSENDITQDLISSNDHSPPNNLEISKEQPKTTSNPFYSSMERTSSTASSDESIAHSDVVADTLESTLNASPVSSMNAGQTRHLSATSTSTASQGPSSSQSTPKKASTFRRLQPRNSRSQPPTQTRQASGSSSPLAVDVNGQNDVETPPIPRAISPVSPTLVPLIVPTINVSISHASQQSSQAHTTHTSSVSRSLSTSPAIVNEPIASERHSRSNPPSSRKPAPYRPGFQPKGVYRPLTDEFLASRRSTRDGDGGMKRVERTKLERRLEKLILLHFPHHIVSDGSKESLKQEARPNLGTFGRDKRRASSFFDFQNLRNLNINDAGDLWRGVVTGGLGDTTKADIRAAEQRITPWQDDAAVGKCPLCSAAFHPLTNRKHHCRLCGQIICSLPVKHPQRKALCSILFVVDTQTRQIEEVGEGVDYGVRRRRTDSISGQQGWQEEEDKFLKGVRICRECRPIILKQQYHQQAQIVPPFAKLYEDFISLETDIEESLPKFHELLMSLTHNDQPTKEASAARKRLLDSFAQYDKLSKRIRALPCPNGPGSSQDRVQGAILTRANLFLQKNMFPLQSLPTPQTSSKVSAPSKSSNGVNVADISNISVDIDSALAHSLQPLLEQESLLESFVAEAQMQRKFEDVKTLKSNLAEIRQEIERLMEGSKR